MSAYFIPPYRTFALPTDTRTVCQVNGEHGGDVEVLITGSPEAIERWSCCGESEVVGEVFDCDDCKEPGVAPHGADLPPGWIEDTNGFHCELCTPKEWSIT